MKIIILSANTGNGHHAVMNSIYSYLKDKCDEIELFPMFYEELIPSNKIMSDFYNLLQATSFEMCKVYTQMSLLSNTNKFNNDYEYWKEALDKFLIKNSCNIIISTTPLINKYIIKYLHETNANQRFYIVVTDPFDPIYPGFSVKGADLYFVANEVVKTILLKNGIEEDKIIISGYPLNQAFFQITKDYEIKFTKGSEFNIKQKTILINCGAQGSFHYINIIRKVYEDYYQKANIIVICGKNKVLYNMCLKNFNIIVLGYVEDIQNILSISDICITKAGANTFYECLYTKTAMLVDATKGLLYQEEGVKHFLNEKQVGNIFYNLDDLAIYLEQMLNKNKLLQIKQNINNMQVESGGENILKFILG